MHSSTRHSIIWRIALLVIAIHCSLFTASAQGWPSDYKGVMLQGFYWDGYADSRWTTLEKQADELSEYFDIIWVPNSAYANALTNNMGYHPVYWFDHKSAFGTEAELRSMIQTFKKKGVGFIEDVVINHRASVDNDWLHFPAETYKGETYQLTAADICQDDESKNSGFKPTGAKDSGEAWGGARDLDHSGANVQKNVKAYLDFLLNDLGYVGFRYDFVKGYAAKYTGLYNTAANPTYSVGECWDGNKTVVTNWINGTKVDGKIQSAAFDFPLKYKINSAFGGGNWGALKDQVLSNDNAYKRYSVTFVDNHDSFRSKSDGGDPLTANICAANAYILTMPGTPCLFLKHWMSNKGTLKKLIALRKAAGISNESEITTAKTTDGGFELSVKGKNGTLHLLLGNVQPELINTTADITLAVSGKKFAVYADASIDLSKVNAITEADESPEDDTPVEVPSFCTVNEGETCAFFVAPKSWGSQIKCWRWDRQYNYTGNSWPGVNCEKLGEDSKGHTVWKWTYNASDRKNQSSSNEGIIFNDGTNQTADLAFTNGGYYNQEGLQAVVSSTGIRDAMVETDGVMKIYTLDGRLLRTGKNSQEALNGLKKGVYIINGKKFIYK